LQGPNFNNPQTGYRRYIETETFIDFFLLQELSKNIDAFKRSSYLTKDRDSKGGKLKAGPHWDYNSAWNLHYCGFDTVSGWTYPMTCWINQSYKVPFWWSKLLQDTTYANEMKCRWLYHRSNALDTAVIFHVIDSVANYIKLVSSRHFTEFNFAANFQNQVDSLKDWIGARLTWMDANMFGNCWNTAINDINKTEFSLYPNPTNEVSNLKFNLSDKTKLNIAVYDMLGRKVIELNNKEYLQGNNDLEINTRDLPKGVYLIKINSQTQIFSSLKLIKQ